MNLRRIQPRKQFNEEEQEELQQEKPKRTRIRKRPEKEKSPLTGFLAFAVLIGIGVLFLFSTLSDSDPKVQGVKTTREQEQMTKEASVAASAIRGRFEDRLESIKEQVLGLTDEDIVANSPQVEKIIEDLQSLQKLPQKQVKQTCEAICEAL